MADVFESAGLNRRLDGRSDGTTRPISLNLDTLQSANGSCMCKVGGNVVMAGVNAKLAKAMQGRLTLGVDVAPFALSQMKHGQSTELQASLSERIHGLLIGQAALNSDLAEPPVTSSSSTRGCLDLGKLVVEEGKASWNLCLDILVLNMDGSVLDACVLAAMAALTSLKLPEVTTNAEGEVVKVSETPKNVERVAKRRRRNEDEVGQVEMRHRPFSVSLALQKDGRVLLDPSGEEELSSGCVVTVMIDEESNLHGLFLPGGSYAVSPDQLLHCIESAKLHRKELDALLTKSIFEA
jgi:exosome complex component RRP43